MKDRLCYEFFIRFLYFKLSKRFLCISTQQGSEIKSSLNFKTKSSVMQGFGRTLKELSRGILSYFEHRQNYC